MQLKYNSVEELVAAASSSNKKISEIVLEQQAEDMETSPEDVYSTMESSFEVMRQSVLNGMDETLRSSSGLSGGAAAKLKKAVEEGKNHYGHLLVNAISPGRDRIQFLHGADRGGSYGRILRSHSGSPHIRYGRI